MSQLSRGLGRGEKPAAPVTLIAVEQKEKDSLFLFDGEARSRKDKGRKNYVFHHSVNGSRNFGVGLF